MSKKEAWLMFIFMVIVLVVVWLLVVYSHAETTSTSFWEEWNICNTVDCVISEGGYFEWAHWNEYEETYRKDKLPDMVWGYIIEFPGGDNTRTINGETFAIGDKIARPIRHGEATVKLYNYIVTGYIWLRSNP